MAKTENKKIYKQRVKWSTNIETIGETMSAIPIGPFIKNFMLCSNPVQSPQTVSQYYTAKNVEVQFVLDTGTETPRFENLAIYIMYVPQGMAVNENLIKYHPEYIMALQFFGGCDFIGNTTGRSPMTVKTSLARKLFTGDSIQFIVTGSNVNTGVADLYLNGVVRWWTKAN